MDVQKYSDVEAKKSQAYSELFVIKGIGRNMLSCPELEEMIDTTLMCALSLGWVGGGIRSTAEAQ